MGGYPDETVHGAWNILLICRDDDPPLLENFIDELISYLEKEPSILPLVEVSENDFRLRNSLDWVAMALRFMANRKPSLLREQKNFFKSAVYEGVSKSRLNRVMHDMKEILLLLDSQ